MSTSTDVVSGPATPQAPPEKWPAFEDEEGHIKVLDGKTLSKGNGWWSAVLLVDTYGKVQVKLYLWQQREQKDKPGVYQWKRKQSWTVNSFNWPDMEKTINEFLEKRKAAKPTTSAYQRK
jgi:hypothetical protein